MIATAWSQLPVDRPIRLSCSGFTEPEWALDSLPEDAPLIFGYRTAGGIEFRTLVDEVIGMLESTAIDMFPAWLPGGSQLSDGTLLSVEAGGVLADREAKRRGIFAPYLRALTRAALGVPAAMSTFSREVRIDHLSRTLAAGSDHEHRALLIDVTGPVGRDLELAADWLSRHGRMGVWITAGTADRFQQWELHVDPAVPTSVDVVTDGFSDPRSGRPRSDSPIECMVEDSLRRRPWAAGREWNKTLRIGSVLTSPVCADLVWSGQRVVVEFDGPEHRLSGKYAADRRRDNMLQLRGYMTLRFTNEQVMDDIAVVLDHIRAAVERPGRTQEVRNHHP